MTVDGLVPDWRVQASFKFGIGQEHMLNVRADDFEELAALLENVPNGLAAKLGSAAGSLNGVTALTTQGVQVAGVTEHVQQPGSPPRCAHDVRVYRKSKPGASRQWEAFFCNTPQNAPNKCDAIFKDDANAHEPYWP